MKTVLDSIWEIAFQPNQKYAENVINNLKRNYSEAIFGYNSMNYDGTIITQFFTDLAQKQLSNTSSLTYKNGKMISSEYLRDGEISGKKHYFNSSRLLDSLVFYLGNKKEDEIQFKYLSDRIISRYNKILSRDDYLLNEKFQISKKINFDDRNNTQSENLFFYDDLGRLIRGEYYSSGKKTSTNFFEYETREQERFSKLKIVPSDGSYVSEKTNTIIDGEETFINTMNGKLQSKSVYYMKNCQGKVLMHNNFNEIIGVSAQKKKQFTNLNKKYNFNENKKFIKLFSNLFN